MFNEETCTLCGLCLSECPFMELSEESAKEEFRKIVETRHSDTIINRCARCLFCNTICPADSNPADMMTEIIVKHNSKYGVPALSIISEENPENAFSLRNEFEDEERIKELRAYSNPPKSSEMLYLGCAIPRRYKNLAKTELFRNVPLMGDVKYCCGASVGWYFGIEEARIRGEELLREFKKLNIKKLITVCPGCHWMITEVYPNSIDGWDIEAQTVLEYLVAKCRNGELVFRNKIKKKIAFQDPCPWRKANPKIYESPRELLALMGAKVVEMKHNRRESQCCGVAPPDGIDPEFHEKFVSKKVSEAEEQRADAIAVACAGCLSISKKAAERNIETFHMIDLALEATGEKSMRRDKESLQRIRASVKEKIKENPKINDNCIFKNGKMQRL